jgi:GntR family transcriptional regulator, transcriptional repressor for pyruvate dehydrogenase complex
MSHDSAPDCLQYPAEFDSITGMSAEPARSPAAFSPAKATRAFDDVIQQLRERIYSGELRPGDRLPPERTLAEQFQVSRNTLREALRMLEITGIVEMRTGATGGAFIREGRPEYVARSLSDMLWLGGISLEDLTEARVWLSSKVIQVACDRATAEDLDRLQANVDDAARLAEQGDWGAVAVVNIEFHNLLASVTGNAVLAMIQRSIMAAMREVSLVAGPIRSDMTIQSRIRFLEHLRARRVAEAEQEMESNLRRVHEYFLAHNASAAFPTTGTEAAGDGRD